MATPIKRLSQQHNIETASFVLRRSARPQKLCIRRQGAASKEEANRIHHQVGQQVRRFIIEELEGTPPEMLSTPSESVQMARVREQRRIQAEQ